MISNEIKTICMQIFIGAFAHLHFASANGMPNWFKQKHHDQIETSFFVFGGTGRFYSEIGISISVIMAVSIRNKNVKLFAPEWLHELMEIYMCHTQANIHNFAYEITWELDLMRISMVALSVPFLFIQKYLLGVWSLFYENIRQFFIRNISTNLHIRSFHRFCLRILKSKFPNENAICMRRKIL